MSIYRLWSILSGEWGVGEMREQGEQGEMREQGEKN
jgi:hypothetical protein